MKPQFNLRVCSQRSRGNPSTKAKAEVVRKSISKKKKLLTEAVAWRKEAWCKGPGSTKNRTISAFQGQKKQLLVRSENCQWQRETVLHHIDLMMRRSVL